LALNKGREWHDSVYQLVPTAAKGPSRSAAANSRPEQASQQRRQRQDQNLCFDEAIRIDGIVHRILGPIHSGGAMHADPDWRVHRAVLSGRLPGPLLDEVDSLANDIEESQFAAHEISNWLSKHVATNDVLPELAALLKRLNDSLQNVASATNTLRGRLTEPIGKFPAGRPLTSWEYHLLAGEDVFSAFADRFPMGTAKAMGVSPVTDFDAFAMASYDDDKRWVYINPIEKPKPSRSDMSAYLGEGHVGMRFGTAPEDLDLEALRPEQRAFFERYRPDIYARFRRGSPQVSEVGRLAA
jgi:hypothetical protein